MKLTEEYLRQLQSSVMWATFNDSPITLAPQTVGDLLADLEEAEADLELARAQRDAGNRRIEALTDELATVRQQLAEAQAREKEALDMLDSMFSKYENGVSCFESPEEQSGFLGYAVYLPEDEFNRIADALNGREAMKPGHLGRSALQSAIEQAVAPYRRDADRWRGVVDLCGYVQDGSCTTIRIYQDDATRTWVVQNSEGLRWYGDSAAQAIDTALSMKENSNDTTNYL